MPVSAWSLPSKKGRMYTCEAMVSNSLIPSHSNLEAKKVPFSWFYLTKKKLEWKEAFPRAEGIHKGNIKPHQLREYFP